MKYRKAALLFGIATLLVLQGCVQWYGPSAKTVLMTIPECLA